MTDQSRVLEANTIKYATERRQFLKGQACYEEGYTMEETEALAVGWKETELMLMGYIAGQVADS